MVESHKMTHETKQLVTLFTLKQQLYHVALDVLWAYPEQFQNFVPRLGGMHMLMSIIGAVGSLMSNSGLEELMNSAFGGVTKMLSGKKFPQNLRALRIVAKVLLQDVMPTAESFFDLMSDLEERYDYLGFVQFHNWEYWLNGLFFILFLFTYIFFIACRLMIYLLYFPYRALRSRISRMWVVNLIKPVLIMMQYVRAERKGDWPLHLDAVASMIPYFFTSAHFNYARYV